MLFKKTNRFVRNVEYDPNLIKDEAILRSLEREQLDLSKLEKFIVHEPPRDKKCILSVKNLKKSFNNGKLQVLKGISIDFYQGENVAILGANGAGKTVFVETITGINKYDSGEITYNLGQKYSFQEKMGIQFQDSTYPKGLRVCTIIDFFRYIFSSSLGNDELNAMIHIFGINEFYKRKASSLSGGQSQRLNCLLSLLHRPSFLILDEVSTGLDVSSKTRIRNFVKDYASINNLNILLISHDTDEINLLVDRIIIFCLGEIFVDAPMSKIKEKFGGVAECLDCYI